MLNFPSEEIYIATKYVDMRRSFDGLAMHIQDSLGNSITFDFGSIKTDYAGRIKRFDNLYDEKTAEDED